VDRKTAFIHAELWRTVWRLLRDTTGPENFHRGLSHPQAMQIILSNDDSRYFDASGELNVIFEPFLGLQSVIGLSGDRHRRMRKLMMPPFHGERMRSYGQLITNITDEVMRGRIVWKAFFALEMYASNFNAGDLEGRLWFG
jgi:cytochrome P450